MFHVKQLVFISTYVSRETSFKYLIIIKTSEGLTPSVFFNCLIVLGFNLFKLLLASLEILFIFEKSVSPGILTPSTSMILLILLFSRFM
jgi:hypothetical protein